MEPLTDLRVRIYARAKELAEIRGQRPEHQIAAITWIDAATDILGADHAALAARVAPLENSIFGVLNRIERLEDDRTGTKE